MGERGDQMGLNGPYGQRERIRWEREVIRLALNGPYGLREREN